MKGAKKQFSGNRKVIPPRIAFVYDESLGNEEILQDMYNRVFEIAKQNILARRRHSNIL